MSDVAGKPVSAHDVAAEIRRRLPGVPTKKLHKLLYYGQGHHLGTFGVPLFTETISAWDMGPVVGELWYREGQQEPPPPPRRLIEAQLNTIGYVLSRYGALTGTDLENLTHAEAPWQTADRIRQPGGRATIRHEWIRDYFVTYGNPAADEEGVPLDSEAVAEWLAGAQPAAELDTSDDREKLLAMRAEIAGRLTRAR